MRRMTGPQLEERLKALVNYLDKCGRRVARITLCCSREEAIKAGVRDDNGSLRYTGPNKRIYEVVLTKPGKL